MEQKSLFWVSLIIQEILAAMVKEENEEPKKAAKAKKSN